VARSLAAARLGVMSLLLLAASCRGGCARAPEPTPGHRLLATLPAGTRFVASVDLARIRATALWSRVAALAAESPQDRQRIQRLQERAGLDPLKQIHRIVAAFPDDARQSGEFALVIEGQGFDEQRLVAYAREEGARPVVKTRGGHTLYTSGNVAGFFAGPGRFVLGGGGWAEAMADLADHTGKTSAADDLELEHLVERIDPARSLWFAALVPADLRRSLMADPKLGSAASVTRLAASADLGPGLYAELAADLSNAADAQALLQRIQASVRESKRNARMLILGLGPYLDALNVRADGPALRATLVLAEPQMKDLLDRLAGLLRLARGVPR
jgi:hypothetical protein